MTKNTPEYNQEEENTPKKTKLSIKQQLTKLFVTSDIKNKNLWKPLRTAKSELIRNLHDGGFDVAEVNSLFWVYFHDHKDVYIPRYLKSIVSKQDVFVDRVDRTFSLQEYLFVLKKIRLVLEPGIKNIQKLLTIAKTYANDVIDTERSEDIYSSFDQEEDAEQYHKLAKQKFLDLVPLDTSISDIYSDSWFDSMCNSIGSNRVYHDYKDLILFAVLGMHYFNKKKLVYGAFTQEDLVSSSIYFQGSSKNAQSFSCTLGDFLAIVEQLNFKKEFFDL